MKYLIPILALLALTGCTSAQKQVGTKFVVREAMRLELILDGDDCAMFVAPGDEIIILSEFRKVTPEKQEDKPDFLASK